MSAKWKLVNDYILRSTGFAYADLERLRFTRTIEAIEQLFAREQERDHLLHVAQQEQRGEWIKTREDGLYWKKLKKALFKQQPLSEADLHWIAQVDGPFEQIATLHRAIVAAQEAKTLAMQVFEQEIKEKRAELAEIVKQPRFQEAVFLSSPQMFKKGLLSYLKTQGGERNAEAKRLERQLIAYLQRLVGKNETTSFFGPINYGTFSAEQNAEHATHRLERPHLHYHRLADLQRRETFMAYWATQALADRFSALPSVYHTLKPQRSFLHRMREGEAVQVALSQKEIFLSPPAYRLFQLADGTKTVEQLEQLLELSRAEMRELLASLTQQKLIALSIEVPVTTTRTLEWLEHELQNVVSDDPEVVRWQRAVQQLRELKDQFSPATVAEKDRLLAEANAIFQALTEQETVRRGGQMYADRTLFYEECHGHLEQLNMSIETRHDWEERLAPILQLSTKHALQVKEQQRKFAMQVFRELYGEQNRMIPFIRFMTDAMRHEKWDAWSQAFRALHSICSAQFTDKVRERAEQNGARTVQFSQEELYEWLGEVTPDSNDPLFCSPDLMIVPGASGQPEQLILGEIHDTVLLWGWALAFHPDEAAIRERMWEELASIIHSPMGNMLGSKRLKIVPFEYPGYTIQMKARSVSPRHQKKAVSELYVCPGESLQLKLLPEGDAIRLYNGELHSMAHEWFSIPRVVPFKVETGKRTPRIVIGDVVYQRERWNVTRADGWSAKYNGTSFELFYDMLKFRNQLGMPECVYVKIATEPKPFLIDFHNYFLLEMWEAFMDAQAVAVVSEMLPVPDQLWLRDAEGRAHCAEFRTSVFYQVEGQV